MATTQFEACDARRAFPCWDEPSIKSTFTVHLNVDPSLVALSNMDVEKTEVNGNLSRVSFNKTPIMSTYLVAFIVGELEHIETKTKSGTLVRVFATKGQSVNGKFGLEVAARTLEFFEEYFDVAYPLPKMDLVAIPDFAAGAMENWGLVTYRTIYLLFDEKSSSLRTKQNVAYVVGHELAHQWFGNLVTMEWWSDLWLNEGFATWVGWLAADHLFPEWNIWTQFLSDDFSQGLHLDCLHSSHAIQVPVRNPSEISQIFDAISYSKGASVIRMLVAYLGEDVFRQGIRSYLKKFQYSNAKTSDLWNSLSEASGKSVNDIMASWTEQVGFPLLKVEEVKQKDALCLKLEQNRYIAGASIAAKDNHQWHIPLSLKHGEELDNSMLSERSGSVNVALDSTFKFNYQQTGFYRVQYTDETINRLGEAVAAGKFNASDRLGIISDAFALASDGYCSATVPLSLLEFYKNETDYIVWSEIASGLSQIKIASWEEPEEFRENLKQVIRTMCEPLAKKLGFDVSPNDDDLTKFLRALVISLAGKNGDEWVISECKKRFDACTVTDCSSLNPDLRGTIFSLAVEHGSESNYSKMKEIYSNSKVIDEKLAALSALGSSPNPITLEETLKLVLGTQVRNQDIMYVIRSVAMNRIGKPLAWKFVQTNWDDFHRRFYSSSTALLCRIVSGTTEHFASDKFATEVESFFQGKQVEAIQRTIDQSCEKIRKNAKWITRDRVAVSEWLKKAIKKLVK